MDALRDSILTQGPHMVLLNEVCLWQADRLTVLLENAGVSMSGALGATTGRSRCSGDPGEQWFGNAVFVSGQAIGGPELIQLPNSSGAGEVRSAVSLVAGFHGVPISVSSAHLIPQSYDPAMSDRQIQALAGFHNQLAESGRAVVFGGDFNMTPEQLTGVLPPAGHFQEVDFPRNRRTYKARKIDFIFMTTERFYALSGETKRSSYSDHRQLWGEAMLRVD